VTTGNQHKPDLEEFTDDIRASQRNIVWPGPLVNSRGVDAFLWRGSPNPTAVQRIGAWLFGIVDTGCALILAAIAWHEGGSALILLGGMGILVFALGAKTFSNGFAKRKAANSR
jgi:hypothetical protein